MERSTASLTYKGSISEAIVEAKRQKKLFVVYISGEDEISAQLEQSTFAEKMVAESVSRYCIFLHLMQGSLDAEQFSAIYPQKSVPSITAVGYNGLMLWQHEGYFSKEDFVGRIEKVWASLHFQETAASLLTAALASKTPEAQNSTSASSTEGNSTVDIASTSEGKSAFDSNVQEEQMVAKPVTVNDSEPCIESSSQLGTFEDVEKKEEQETSLENNIRKNVTSSEINVRGAVPGRVNREIDGDVPIPPKEQIALTESYVEASQASHGKIPACLPESNQTTVLKKSKTEEVVEPIASPKAIKSVDLYLNIRLPSGSSLQRKFTITDTLRSVKSYVDENQASNIGSYDLAIPYPRKVYGEEDMNSFLSELGFAGRQTLIVVPRRGGIKPQKVASSSQGTPNTISAANTSDAFGGYFAFLKRTLSYLNPFSYLGGSGNSSNNEPVPTENSEQYRSSLGLQGRQLSRGESSNGQFGLNQRNPSSGESTGETRQRASRPFGSNIHTLRHDEDDFSSRDRNTFWNGNSTQYGGDDKK